MSGAGGSLGIIFSRKADCDVGDVRSLLIKALTMNECEECHSDVIAFSEDFLFFVFCGCGVALFK